MPFAERPFERRLVAAGSRLPCTISERAGNGSPVTSPSISSSGPVHQAAGPFVLRHRVGHRVAGREIRDRIAADDDHDRAGLAGLEVLVAVDAALLAVRDVRRAGVRPLHLHAIGADVDAPGVGIAGDDAARGADVAAAVVLVVDRHRELQHVDLVVAHDVLEHRAVASRSSAAMRLKPFLMCLRKWSSISLRLSDSDGSMPSTSDEPVRRAEHAVGAAVALRVVGDVVEEQHRRLLDLLPVEHLGDGAELAVPVRIRQRGRARRAARPAMNSRRSFCAVGLTTLLFDMRRTSLNSRSKIQVSGMLYCSAGSNASKRPSATRMLRRIGNEPEKGQNATALGLLAPVSIH